MSRKDGGAAFPRPFSEDRGNTNQLEYAEEGMSLRDYFAAQAIGSVIRQCTHDDLDEGQSYEQHVARAAGRIADEMISERNK